MSDPNSPLDYVRAAVTDLTPIGFTSRITRDGDQIIVTLTKGAHSRSITLPAAFEEADSAALTDALQMPMERARLELANLDAKKPKRKKAKAKKRKKAKKAKRKTRVKLVDASPELQADVDEALEPVTP